MKPNSLMAAACAAALLLANPMGVLAENPSQPGKLVAAGKLEGKQVNNLQSQKIGELKQVLLDPKSGQARYGVVEVDKAWSLNDPEIAVPFGAFRISVNPNNNDIVVQLDATKEKLQNAPHHKVGEADQLYTEQASHPIYSYWAITWYDVPSASSKSSGKTAGATPPSSSSGSTAGAHGNGSVKSETSTPKNK